MKSALLAAKLSPRWAAHTPHCPTHAYDAGGKKEDTTLSLATWTGAGQVEKEPPVYLLGHWEAERRGETEKSRKGGTTGGQVNVRSAIDR